MNSFVWLLLLAPQDPAVGPFLKKHCLECHGPEKRKGEIRLDRLAAYRLEETHLWTRIHEQISTMA